MEILGAAVALFIVSVFGYLLLHGPMALARFVGRSLEKASETPETREADEIMSRASRADKTQFDGD